METIKLTFSKSLMLLIIILGLSVVSCNTKSNDSKITESSEVKVSDIDKMLDDYEAYVDQYLKFLKKAMDGDMKAMAEYPTLLEKANNLSISLKEAQESNNMNSKQVERMLKINNKMLEEAVNMNDNMDITIPDNMEVFDNDMFDE